MKKAKNRTREERIRSRTMKLFDVNDYDCVLAITIVGIISRIIMLVLYVATTHWIKYDYGISIWGMLAKSFWIYVDIIVIRTWREQIRPKITRDRVDIVNPRAVMIFRAAALLLSGYSFYQAIFLHHLNLFFIINKIMVMGSMGILYLLLIYRTLRVAYLLNGAADEYIDKYINR